MLWEYVITRINKLFLAKEDDPDWIGCELSEVARGLTLILTTRPQTQSLTDQILHWPPNEDRLNPLLSGWAELSLCWNLNSIQPSHLPQLTPSWFLWQFLLDLSTQQRSTTTIGPNRSRSIQSNSMVAFHLATKLDYQVESTVTRSISAPTSVDSKLISMATQLWPF